MSGERPRFERRDIQPGSVLRAGIIIALVTALSAAGMYVLFRSLKGGGPATEVAGPPQPPEPRLQTDEVADLRMVLAPQRERLESYGWVDAKQGIVSIPIELAMQRVLEEGLPARPRPVASAAAPVPTDAGGIR